MIRVTLGKQAQQLMQYIEVMPSRVGKTFNERHRGGVVAGNPMRMGAIHWYEDQTVFALGSVKKSRREGERVHFEEVSADLVIDVTGELPSDTLKPEMDFNHILGIVANSFGLPVVTARGCPPSAIHYKAPWDGSIHVENAKEDKVFLQGVFNRQKRECHYVWAFSLRRYLAWYEGRRGDAATEDGCAG